MDNWQKATIKEEYAQTPDFRTLILEPSTLQDFKAGNFVEIAVSKNGAFKCYSVVSTPEDKKVVEVGVKLYENGALSPQLFALKKGDTILMRGPAGAYFIWEPGNRTTVAIGGGAGICPMVSILRQFDPRLGELHILFSTKQGSVYYGSELKETSAKKGVDYTLVETSGSGGDRIDKVYLESKFGKLISPATDFFVAGPTEFVQDVSYWLRELGVEEKNLRTDDFGS